MIAIRGTLKRSKRRAYLVFYDKLGIIRALRLMDAPEAMSGLTCTVTGTLTGKTLHVARLMPHKYPRARLENADVW